MMHLDSFLTRVRARVFNVKVKPARLSCSPQGIAQDRRRDIEGREIPNFDMVPPSQKPISHGGGLDGIAQQLRWRWPFQRR